jgi:hypothetical protein
MDRENFTLTYWFTTQLLRQNHTPKDTLYNSSNKQSFISSSCATSVTGGLTRVLWPVFYITSLQVPQETAEYVRILKYSERFQIPYLSKYHMKFVRQMAILE